MGSISYIETITNYHSSDAHHSITNKNYRRESRVELFVKWLQNQLIVTEWWFPKSRRAFSSFVSSLRQPVGCFLTGLAVWPIFSPLFWYALVQDCFFIASVASLPPLLHFRSTLNLLINITLPYRKQKHLPYMAAIIDFVGFCCWSMVPIAIQEISKEYQQQKTSLHNPMDESARRPRQFLVEAGAIT